MKQRGGGGSSNRLHGVDDDHDHDHHDAGNCEGDGDGGGHPRQNHSFGAMLSALLSAREVRVGLYHAASRSGEGQGQG